MDIYWWFFPSIYSIIKRFIRFILFSSPGLWEAILYEMILPFLQSKRNRPMPEEYITIGSFRGKIISTEIRIEYLLIIDLYIRNLIEDQVSITCRTRDEYTIFYRAENITELHKVEMFEERFWNTFRHDQNFFFILIEDISWA